MAQALLRDMPFDDSEAVQLAEAIMDSAQTQISVAMIMIEGTEKKTATKVDRFEENIVHRFRDDEFRNRFRLSRTQFEFVLQFVAHPDLEAQPRGIPVEKQLLVFLDYISHQTTQLELSTLYGISKGAISSIVQTMPRKLVPTLSREVIQWPSRDAALKNAAVFFARYGFPDVIGAIDGSHIEISIPTSDYTSRKYRQAITLQAVAGPDLSFIDVMVGCTGRMHDAKVFEYSPISDKLMEEDCSHGLHLIGDGAYAVRKYMMVPFSDNGFRSDEQLTFNTRLSAARQVVERAFGQLKNRFRRLKFLHKHKIEDMCFTITAACALHNVCVMKNDTDAGYGNYRTIFNNANFANGQEKRNAIVNYLGDN